MRSLVVNCGSSSLKCGLYAVESGERLARGSIDRIGASDATLTCEASGLRESRALETKDHAAALEALCTSIFALSADAAGSEEILAVGHRVVHGGERFSEATLIDGAVEAAIEELAPLAPVHNPLCLRGIRAARKLLPRAQQIAVFDTAFHQTLPEAACLYAVPYDWYERDGVRRHGFHGTSHRWVAARTAARWPDRASRLVVCHLGAGCSTTAILDGRSVDTSMGMTPLEGLVMGTRSGDVDPGVIAFIAKRRGLDIGEVEGILNHESGLLGVSGLSADIRELEGHAAAGHARAELALEIFAHRARKYIGAHHATLGGATAVAFTGGAGENSPSLRSRILRGLDGLGMFLDTQANSSCKGGEAVISTPASPVALLVVPTDEEQMIAREVHALVSGT